MTATKYYCENCGVEHTPPAEDKADGQLCGECLTHGPLIRLTESEADDEPRYLAGFQMTADFLDEGFYGEWHEFNETEYARVKADWDQLPELDTRSFESLKASANAMLQFLGEFWNRHADILQERDAAMNEWSQIKSGEREKPIYWTKIPDFRVILTEV